MDRLVRERGSVGRRLWRRRRKKPAPPGSEPAEQGASAEGAEAASEGDDGDDGDEASEPAFEQPFAPPAPPRPGFFAALKSALSGKPKPPPPEPSYLILDPAREVLAVPRGAARLDAFERALQGVLPGTPAMRSLALAFHKELSSLADAAGVDLSLLEARVEACARALIDAGEEERAGALYLRVGRRHQAAELFVAAGAIDALEEAHAMITWDEGGAKHEARMSFERFEALYVVGLREQALEALEKAKRLWHDNPIYGEIYAAFVERLGPRRRLPLTAGPHELVVLARWPVVIGRGEEADVRINSPMLSRAHLQIELGVHEGKAGPIVVDLDSRSGTHVDGRPLSGKQPLRPGADIDMAGVVVHSGAVDGGILLWAALAPERRTLAATAALVKILPPGGSELPATEGIDVRFDAKGRAFAEPGATVNGEVIHKPMLLLEGDKLGGQGWRWTVARHKG